MELYENENIRLLTCKAEGCIIESEELSARAVLDARLPVTIRILRVILICYGGLGKKCQDRVPTQNCEYDLCGRLGTVGRSVVLLTPHLISITRRLPKRV